MSTTVKAGWLKDSQGNKFAPKTAASQVITNDGATIEEKLTLDSMDLNSSQTATGVKTFENGIKIGDASLTYDLTNKRIVISFS